MFGPIDAIVVNYHTERQTLRLIEDLLREPLIATIWVVDNSRTFFSEKSKRIRILRPPENLGYGRGVNLAARESKAPYILVLNPDIRLLPQSVSKLFEAAEESDATILGPRFYWDEGLLFRLPPAEGEALFWKLAKETSTLSPYDAQLLSYYWRLRHQRFWQAQAPFWEPFLVGAALLVRMKDFPAREIFDHRYFLYFEDTALSYRLEKERRLQLCVPGAEMIHYWNASPDPPEGKKHLFGVSQRLFLKTLYGSFYLKIFLGGTLRFIRYLKFFKRFKHFELPWEDLGTLSKPPKWGEPFKVEIALSPLFIPFAESTNPWSELPSQIWSRLPTGRYYLRLIGAYDRPEKFLTFKKIERAT